MSTSPTHAPRYEYLTVPEVAPLLEKCPSRLYAMVAEGLLDQVGWLTFRSPRGRIWIGIPRCGLDALTSAEVSRRSA